MKSGDRLQIVNGKIKKAIGEELEINVDAGTYLGLIPASEEFCEIAQLKEGMGIVNVEGEVATEPVAREVKTSRGEVVKLTTFELKDETGKVLVSAWRENADIAAEFEPGIRVAVRNVYVKKAFSGDQLEISTRSDTSFTTVD